MKKNAENNLIIFASGAGSNAQQIINYFKKDKKTNVALIVCNNPRAGVLQIAANEQIPVLLIQKDHFKETGYLAEIQKYDPDLVVLAGFLWKIPGILITHFPEKIINIHPALLPAYGGKGMYGSAVHTAVINAKEKESGITIHFVDDIYDHGKVIFQAKCNLNENETAETLAHKIHQLEHQYYPVTIDKLLKGSKKK
ncbi:MAG TPA: phosphoribosylglycinamide formyltransferase [Hanamia sp.]|nr:phosphoribosylglycinamide formyltransferase [Hanamia sp.]